MEERREFIRQWRVEITEEIAGMECRARATICHQQYGEIYGFSSGGINGGYIGFASAILVGWLINR